jgi:hypothetical protein
MSNQDDGSGSGSAVSREEARDKIYTFLAREGCRHSKDTVIKNLDYTGINEHPDLGDLFMYDSPYGEFRVSARRGNVMMFNAPPRLNVEGAGELIREFLCRHIPEFEQRNFRLTDSYMEGSFWNEEYIEKPEEGHSIFQNWISISIDMESRNIHNFSYTDLRHIRYVPPRIDEKKARELILQKYSDGEILELELMEHTDDGGMTWVTIWNALVSPLREKDVPDEIISINADTGEEVPL